MTKEGNMPWQFWAIAAGIVALMAVMAIVALWGNNE